MGLGLTKSSQMKQPTSVNWALVDNQGSVRDVIDSNGVVQDHIVYDSYGQVTSETNPGFDFRYGYTGRERDKETGLQYNRARYYDPSTGAFIGQDPIGFAGGDANLYRYVGNSPFNGIDPTGLFSNDVGQFYSDAFMGAVSLTNEAAANGQEFYANRLNNPSVPVYEKPLDFAGGLLSSLATESNLPKTAAVLGSAILASQAIEAGAAKGIGLLKASVKPIHLLGAGLGGGIDLVSQLISNCGDPSKIDPISVAGSAVSGVLGAGLGSSVAKLGPLTLGGMGTYMPGRAILNSLGSGLIGGGVTLGQNAINSNILGKSVGLGDNVGWNSLTSGLLGGFGSFAGDGIEKGIISSQNLINSAKDRAIFERLSVSGKVLWSQMPHYKVPDNSGSRIGTLVGNAIANTGILFPPSNQ